MEEYELKNVKEEENSILKGKTILYLGSSVTYGYKSEGISFADYITKRNGSIMIKEAVSGTTLTESKDSYIERLKKVDTNKKIDIFLCQLSTNDAYCKREFGEIGNSYSIDSFDTNTITGAIEYIIAYSKKYFTSNIVFYTNPYYENEHYHEMVNTILKIKEKWNIKVVDMYNEGFIENLTQEERDTYMGDSIHPTDKGYYLYMTPRIEEVFKDFYK